MYIHLCVYNGRKYIYIYICIHLCVYNGYKYIYIYMCVCVYVYMFDIHVYQYKWDVLGDCVLNKNNDDELVKFSRNAFGI